MRLSAGGRADLNEAPTNPTDFAPRMLRQIAMVLSDAQQKSGHIRITH
jgi:hypothetical protein